MMKLAFIILTVLMAHASLVFSAEDTSTICTNDGNCYTICVLQSNCDPIPVDALCIANYGKQELNEVTRDCQSDVVKKCYLCYGPPTTE